jgi:hypothetical protein
MGRVRKLPAVAVLAAAAAVVAAPASGAGGSALRLAQIQLPGFTEPQRLRSLDSAAMEVAQRTSISAQAESRLVPLTTEDLYALPLLFLPSDRLLPQLASSDAAVLSAWLRTGGTLVIDWQGGGAELDAFRTSVEELVADLVPGAALERVPAGHVLFRSFYRLTYASGRIRLVDDLYAAVVDDRYAVLVSFNDLLSAVERNPGGDYRFDVVPGGQAQREDAVRLLVNIVSYAMCLDYKNDKVHLDYLKSRRNWRLPGEE